MPSGNEHMGAIFVPRTIDAVERTTRTLVARWAAPVRAIGLRALGLADRLLGHHWVPGVPGVPGQRGVRSEVSGELGVWPLPWYEDEADDEALSGRGQRQQTNAGRSSRRSDRGRESSTEAAVAQAGEGGVSAGLGIGAERAPSRVMSASPVEMVPLAAARVDARPQVLPGAGEPTASGGRASASAVPAPADVAGARDAIEVAVSPLASASPEVPARPASTLAMPSEPAPAIGERSAAVVADPVLAGARPDAGAVRQPAAVSSPEERIRSQRAMADASLESGEQAPLAASGALARAVAGPETDRTVEFSRGNEGHVLAEQPGMGQGEEAAPEGAAEVLAKEWVNELGGVRAMPRAARLPAVFRAGAEVELTPSAALRRIYDHMTWVDGRLARHGGRHDAQVGAEFTWVAGGEREETAESPDADIRRRPAMDSRPRSETSRSASSPGSAVEAEAGPGESGPTRAFTSGFEAGSGVAGGLEPSGGGLSGASSGAEQGQATAPLGRGDAERPVTGVLSNAASGAAQGPMPSVRGERDDAARPGPAEAGGIYARDLSSTLSSVIAPLGSAPAEFTRPGDQGSAGSANAMPSSSARAGQRDGSRAPVISGEESRRDGTRPSGLVGAMPRPGAVNAGGRDVALPELSFATALTRDGSEGPSGGVLPFVDRLVGVRAGWEARPLPVAAPLASALGLLREQVLIDLSSGGAPAARRGGAREGSPARSRPEGQGMAASTEWRGGLSVGAGGGRETERVAPVGGVGLSRQELAGMEMAVPAGAALEGPPSETRTNWMAPEIVDSGLGLGAIGRRAEQLGGMIGVRAAGVAVDFIDPEMFQDAVGTRWDAWQMPMVAGAPGAEDAGDATSPTGDAPLFRGRVEGVPREMRQGGTEPGDGGGAHEPHGNGRGVGGPAAPGRIRGRAVGGEAWALNKEEAWALTRVFPSAGGSIPTYLRNDGDEGDEGAGLASGRGPIGRAGSGLGIGGAGELRMGRSAIGSGQDEGRPGRQAGIYRAPEGGALGEVVYVAPDVMQETESLGRPGGRAPRGGYLWSRAAEFARNVRTWELPSTVTAATAGAEAAMSGQPAWQGMTTIETPAVRAALTGADSMVDGEGANDGAVASAGGTPGGPAVREGRLPAPSLQLLEGGASAHESRGGGAGRHLLPPELELLRPVAAPVPAAPVSDASARMVEVMQRQQAPVTGGSSRSGGSDRLSLSDLTLVAVAAATQQVAASTAPASTSSAPRGGGGRDGGGSGKSQGSRMSPEQEHQEIEELARRVLGEVEWMMDAMRDRIGEP